MLIRVKEQEEILNLAESLFSDFEESRQGRVSAVIPRRYLGLDRPSDDAVTGRVSRPPAS